MRLISLIVNNNPLCIMPWWTSVSQYILPGLTSCKTEKEKKKKSLAYIQIVHAKENCTIVFHSKYIRQWRLNRACPSWSFSIAMQLRKTRTADTRTIFPFRKDNWLKWIHWREKTYKKKNGKDLLQNETQGHKCRTRLEIELLLMKRYWRNDKIYGNTK